VKAGRLPRRDACGRLLGLLAVSGPLRGLAAGPVPGEVPVGGLLPDGPLHGLNGPSRRLADYRGRPLIINVWASWCGPCRQEMVSLERLAWHDQAASWALIGISTDDDPARARAWLAQSRATISHFVDRALAWETLLGADRLPLTVVVDAQGRVRDKVVGARVWDSPEALRWIDRALAGTRAGAGARPAAYHRP
jgi:thiol-disulfide isomerase/thioredoxin